MPQSGMKTTCSTAKKYSKCPTCSAGTTPRFHAGQCDSHRRTPQLRPSKSTRYNAFGLLAVSFVCLIILSSFDPSEGRSLGRKRRKQMQLGENDIDVEERGSRHRKKNRTGRVLKTSEEARNITEKRYLKKDWCQKQPLKQFIKLKNGCKGYFLNNFCYGQCNSFYIPRELTPDANEQEAFKSCAFCKPYLVEKVPVTLTCPGRRGRKARKIKRMVNKIKECHCIAVPDIDSRTPAPGRSF